jgi:hypothetical protein
MAMTGKKPDHDLRAEGDGSYVVEFRTAAGEVLAISIPAPSARRSGSSKSACPTGYLRQTFRE